MKILYLHQYFRHPSEGGATRSFEMARRLVEAGHSVVMITSTQDRSSDQVEALGKIVGGIQIVWIRVAYSQTMGYGSRLFAFFRFAVLASWAAIRRPADVVFASSTPLTIAIPGLLCAWYRRRPFVFEVRDLWPEVPIAVGALRHPAVVRLARWLERLSYRHARHIVVLSTDMKKGLLKQGVETDRVTVIPNGSDTELFGLPAGEGIAFRRERPHLAGRRLVLYAGTMGKINGVDYLARIAVEMREVNPDIVFLVVGRGSEEAEVRAAAEQGGVLDTSFFIEASMPKDQVARAFSAADATVSFVIDIPALWANSANKLFDSFAAGRPVVINHEGWQADLIRDHGAGIVVPATDPVAAARAIAGFLGDEGRVRAAAIAARKLSVECFDRGRLAVQLETVLSGASAPRHEGRV